MPKTNNHFHSIEISIFGTKIRASGWLGVIATVAIIALLVF